MHNRSPKTFDGRRNGRRRGTARLFVLGAAFAASAATGALTAQVYAAEPRVSAAGADAPRGQEAQLRFTVNPAPLDEVLAEFERLTRVKVALTDSGIGTIPSPGVIGTFTIR